MVGYWLWTSQKNYSHFADFKQGKKVLVILRTLNKLKNHFTDFEQTEKTNSRFDNFEENKKNISHFTTLSQKILTVVLLRLFYSVEAFLQCGDFQISLQCGNFSTMWRLSEQSTVWRLSVQRASYGIRTCFTVGEYTRSLEFYPFSHRAIQSVID